MSMFRHQPSDHELKCRQKFCKDYDAWDLLCRKNIMRRNIEHLKQRKRSLDTCAYRCLNQVMLKLSLYHGADYAKYYNHRHHNHLCVTCDKYNCECNQKTENLFDGCIDCTNCEVLFEVPQFIIENTTRQMQLEVNHWSGIQLAQCKPKVIAKYQTFLSKAINHQDQNSWKVISECLYVPALNEARKKFKDFVHRLPVAQRVKLAILDELCSGMVYCMLDETIKFRRTKAKKLVKTRALMKSKLLRDAFDSFDQEIKINDWIQKESRLQNIRKIDSNNNPIKRNIAEAVHLMSHQQCSSIYFKRQMKVCECLGIVPNEVQSQVSTSKPKPKPKPKPKHVETATRSFQSCEFGQIANKCRVEQANRRQQIRQQMLQNNLNLAKIQNQNFHLQHPHPHPQPQLFPNQFGDRDVEYNQKLNRQLRNENFQLAAQLKQLESVYELKLAKTRYEIAANRNRINRCHITHMCSPAAHISSCGRNRNRSCCNHNHVNHVNYRSNLAMADGYGYGINPQFVSRYNFDGRSRTQQGSVNVFDDIGHLCNSKGGDPFF